MKKTTNTTKKKKDIKYLNVCMDRELHEEFEDFCEEFGLSKTGATENAVRLYMDEYRKAMKTMKGIRKK